MWRSQKRKRGGGGQCHDTHTCCLHTDTYGETTRNEGENEEEEEEEERGKVEQPEKEKTRQWRKELGQYILYESEKKRRDEDGSMVKGRVEKRRGTQ